MRLKMKTSPVPQCRGDAPAPRNLLSGGRRRRRRVRRRLSRRRRRRGSALVGLRRRRRGAVVVVLVEVEYSCGGEKHVAASERVRNTGKADRRAGEGASSTVTRSRTVKATANNHEPAKKPEEIPARHVVARPDRTEETGVSHTRGTRCKGGGGARRVRVVASFRTWPWRQPSSWPPPPPSSSRQRRPWPSRQQPCAGRRKCSFSRFIACALTPVNTPSLRAPKVVLGPGAHFLAAASSLAFASIAARLAAS